jgi:hypothetical protein
MKRSERANLISERNQEIFQEWSETPKWAKTPGLPLVWILDKYKELEEQIAKKYNLKVRTIRRIIYRQFELLRILDSLKSDPRDWSNIPF